MSKKAKEATGDLPDSLAALKVTVPPDAPATTKEPMPSMRAALPEPPPASPMATLSLEVFCLTSGKKPDQTKAFVGWAKRQGLTVLPKSEWQAQWEKFQNRAV